MNNFIKSPFSFQMTIWVEIQLWHLIIQDMYIYFSYVLRVIINEAGIKNKLSIHVARLFHFYIFPFCWKLKTACSSLIFVFNLYFIHAPSNNLERIWTEFWMNWARITKGYNFFPAKVVLQKFKPTVC